MFLMACKGILTPKPDAAIFADTQWEPKDVYRWLGELARIGAGAGIPIIQVTAGNLRADALRSQVRGRKDGEKRFASMPLRTLSPKGSEGMIRRQCTREYKIEVIEREARRLLGLKTKQRAPKNAVEFWHGISADEASRMRDARAHWYTLRYPLIFDREPPMTRRDCLAWMESHGYPAPRKSACLGCPFHSDEEWRQIKSNSEEWADVVGFDRAIRDCGGMRGRVYLHRSCQPLEEVDFSTAEERGQMNWINECEGMCGV
jgi:hypothetical protein